MFIARILFADCLRILPRFAGFCRAILLKLFRIRCLFRTLDQHIGVRIPGGQPNQIDNWFAAFRIDVRAKRVVIKPNLVDYAPGDAINTHPLLVLAAAESFRRLDSFGSRS